MEMGGESLISNQTEENQNDDDVVTKSEDWCFVCHNGGIIRDCDFPKCGKAYHYKCVGQKKSFLTSNVHWNCARHSCSNCSGKPTITCYCCPKAICHQCIVAAEFSPVKGENGFCKDCLNFVLLCEGIMESDSSLKNMNLGDLSKREKHLKEYYEIIKKQEGLILDNLQSAKGRRKIQEKRKAGRSLHNVDENKRHKVLLNLDSNKTALNEVVASNTAATLFASLVPENLRLVYLRRSLVEKLLKQPESFEDKIKGTFVRVELPRNDVRQRRAYQLVQVTGITKSSTNHDDTDIKLQASNIPNDISIQMLSDGDLCEKECEDHRQQMQSGLLRRPTVEELEQKARILHEDMVDDFIVRELRRVQTRIDIANEKGRRFQLFDFLYRRKQLEAPSERLRLLQDLPVVIAEVLDDNMVSEGIGGDNQGNICSLESIPIKGGQSTVSNCDKLSEGSTSSVPICNVLADALYPRPILKDTMDDKKRNEGSAKLILDKECKGNETVSECSLFKRSPGASAPAEEHMGDLVNYPPANDTTAPVSQTTETNEDPKHMLPENNQNKSMQEQKVNVTRTAINQPDEPSSERTLEEQQSMCSIPAPSLEDTVVTPVTDLNPAMMRESDNKSYLRRELEMLTFSLTLVQDELKSLKLKTEKDACVNVTKITNLEKKLDQMFEHHVKQLGGAQVKPAKEEITSSNKLQMSEEDVMKFLEPICRAGWTKALEEIKAKYLPDLDLSEFPMYDPNGRDKVDLVVKKICESGIKVDHLVSREATEKDCSVPNLGATTSDLSSPKLERIVEDVLGIKEQHDFVKLSKRLGCPDLCER